MQSQTFDGRSSFDRLSFLLGADLLPSIPPSYELQIQRRSKFGGLRPCDIPSRLSDSGRAVPIESWLQRFSTPADHATWRNSGFNLVLVTRRTMAIRAPNAALRSFLDETGVEPIIVREGRTGVATFLFRALFGESPSDPEVPSLPSQHILPAAAAGARVEPIEFLGLNRTVLVYGRAANGSPVQHPNLRSLASVPCVPLGKLERCWQQLARRYRPLQRGLRPPPPLMDPRQQLGAFCYPTLIGQLDRHDAAFARWLVDNGHAIGFDGTQAILIRCPWHPQILSRASNAPARFDLRTGRLMCSHPRCARRTNRDFEIRTGFLGSDDVLTDVGRSGPLAAC